MKKIKVTYMGKRLKDVYPHATKWQVFKYKVRRFFISLFTWAFIIATLFGVYKLGGILNPATIVTQAEVIKEVINAPVLDRIADCESGKRTPQGKGIPGSARQFASNGQVVMTANTNKTVDVGKYAINTVWFAKATEMGLDLTKEEDNKKMAEWIYTNKGTEPWYSSRSCWDR